MAHIIWDDIRYFLAATRYGSFARAGRELRVEHTTIARRVSGLEEKLEARLFDRTRSGLRLTAAGEEIARRARDAETRVHEIERLSGTFADDAAGQVVLATSTVLAEALVVPALGALAHRHPKIELELSVGRGFVDLRRREADIALRLRAPGAPVAQADVVAAKLGDAGFGLYAAASYARSRPRFEDAPQRHRAIRYGSGNPGWEPGGSFMARQSSPTPISLRANDMPAVRAACVAGLGVAVLPHFYTTRTRLRCLVSDVDSAGLFVAVHPDLGRTARVRAVAAWLRTSIRERL